MHVCLFDVDGTLLLGDGAGRAALEAALESEFGLSGPLERVSFAGRTDRAITGELLSRNGVDPDESTHSRCVRAYLEHLPAHLVRRSGKVLPGVVPLLDALTSRGDVALGVLTGNLRAGARLKLAHFGLDRYFAFGGYGDDHHDRCDVARAALADAERHLGFAPAADRVWVIGDTPEDVRCGRAIGARVVAVATGFASVDELEAAGPDHLLRDFADPEPFLRLLTRRRGP
jgi:phosphoglycolate phosphatase-like HAD superfamily hydrolase